VRWGPDPPREASLSQPPSQPRRFRAAIAGTGAIAEFGHLPALRDQAHRVDLVAAVDIVF